MSNSTLPRTTATGRHHHFPTMAFPIGTLVRALASVALTVGFLLALSHVMSQLG